jgi:hypothetical protein
MKPTLFTCPKLAARSEAPPFRLLRDSLFCCQLQHLESVLRRRQPRADPPPQPAPSLQITPRHLPPNLSQAFDSQIDAQPPCPG